MTVEYINTKGKTYYLHKGQTKTGKAKYYFSLRMEGATCSFLPEGYEIYENPANAQVYLRKVPKKIIGDEEKNIVEKGIKKFSDIKLYKIDVRENAILIYTPSQDINELSNIFDSYPPLLAKKSEVIERIINYSPEMQFILIDKNERSFITERYCYLGSVDDWISIGSPGSLDALVEEYIKHLGKDSFFDLY